jgi:uncharacterized membrane protein YqgA involved in biofilm formation
MLDFVFILLTVGVFYIIFGAVLGMIVGSKIPPPVSAHIAVVSGVFGSLCSFFIFRYGIWKFWQPKEFLFVVLIIVACAIILTAALIHIFRFFFVRH